MSGSDAEASQRTTITRLRIAGTIAAFLGLCVFVYYVYAVGPESVVNGVSRVGTDGFVLIVLIYGTKLLVRAYAWHLAVYDGHELPIREAYSAVIIGEAMSSVLPMGILISGTAKAVAVRKRIPLVPGLASVATENLFYSLITAIFILSGAVLFMGRFAVPEPFSAFLAGFLVLVSVMLILGIVMVIRQWHWASGFCSIVQWFGIFPNLLGSGIKYIREFEDRIYGFYRAHPRRFLPLCGLQILFHSLGILEVWFVVSKIGNFVPSVAVPFFLESMSRLVTVVFKLVPFLIGVDEASAEFVVTSLGVAAGLGVTLAIVRKGRTIIWSSVGFVLILRRGLSLSEVLKAKEALRGQH